MACISSEGKKLAKALIKSLDSNDGRWVLRAGEFTGKPIAELITTEASGPATFTVKVVPGRGYCLARLECFETVQVFCQGAAITIPPLSRCKLKKAVEAFALRYARSIQQRVL